ncbi:hypothetical protein M0534_04350 [Methylonatrum kenyense]|uniref:hypothetical protein n=1 Tax=Methylonatrum kenyense TaxID=455253 RepID=UPI0020BDB647|nr:hypothetical protein [Methylonatrum kenyense]MCK8515559.1 hypothetical protein [Methylonatrum kenyense]
MSIHSASAVLTVEVDPAVTGETPGPLGKADAERLGQAIANDLQRLLDHLPRHGLVVMGGLYDSTELLRPGMPVFQAMADLYRHAMPAGDFQPSIMTIGAQGDHFPLAGLEPGPAHGKGPLLLIPFTLLGTGEHTEALRLQMETRLLERGQGSAETGKVISDATGIQPLNLFYTTLDDLGALMRVQLDNAGFHGLWDLIDSALYPRTDPNRCVLDSGHCFLVHHNVAYSLHQTCRHWARHQGPGAADELEDGYAAWQRLLRQYVAGLAAHGLTVCHVPGSANHAAMLDANLERAFAYAQTAALMPDRNVLQDNLLDGDPDRATRLELQRHDLPDLGPVLFAVRGFDANGRCLFHRHDYPLSPAAVHEIPESWRRHAETRNISLGEAVIQGLPAMDMSAEPGG